jgi:hypothetical protein
MHSLSEDWISIYRIDGSGNNFMETLYDYGNLFWIQTPTPIYVTWYWIKCSSF